MTLTVKGARFTEVLIKTSGTKWFITCCDWLLFEGLKHLTSTSVTGNVLDGTRQSFCLGGAAFFSSFSPLWSCQQTTAKLTDNQSWNNY